jgi:hypothetical protein
MVGAFAGGWQVGGIFTHQTGVVGTPLLGIDNASIASPFGNFDRPIRPESALICMPQGR